MVSMAPLVILLFAFVSSALAYVDYPYFMPTANLTCSNTANFLCRTGSCTAATPPGVTDTWAIPKMPDIDESCTCNNGCNTYGKCTKTGSQAIAGYLWWIYVVPKIKTCCTKCRDYTSSVFGGVVQTSCAWWQFRSLAGTPAGSVSAANGGYCYLYLNNPSTSWTPSCTGKSVGSTVVSYSTTTLTTVGAVCDSIHHDPHFVGHHGARFDFNGMPGETFCLITDASLHINMKLSGYLDSRMESAVKVVGGKAVRTWMRELGFMWMADGEEHSLHLATRSGPKVERGDGYLAFAKADGVELARLKEKDELKLAGGLILRFIEVETEGPYTVEFYNVVIADILDIDLRVRVANAKLRTTDDAEVHFSFGINKLQTSAMVHGVLGQTYRTDREERNQDFAAQLRKFATFSADSDNGKGFLDGTTSDYSASAVLSPDCKYTTFNGRVMKTSAE